ncbi:MAG: hypothetical protein IJQ42_02070 [Oscillospiraceae bacterium]|nr:hypothetical protein [Oscillospiraceae bacterium]
MLGEKIRVSVKLKEGCEPEAFLPKLEELLDRPVCPVRILKRARVLSLWMTGTELEKTAALPEVLLARPEGRAELPPKPRFPRE